MNSDRKKTTTITMTTSSQRREANEDDDEWIPLQQKEMPPNQFKVGAKLDTLTNNNNSSTESKSNIDLLGLQKKLERDQKIKQALLDHPLDEAWGNLILHLGREIWGLGLSFRLGIVLVIVGFIVQTIVTITLFSVFHLPKILLILVFVFSCTYIMIPMKRNEEQAPRIVLPSLSASRLRMFFVLVLLFPTLLEARTVGFLANMCCNGGWKFSIFITIAIFTTIVYNQKDSPLLGSRRHYNVSIYILYGSALFVSIIRFHLDGVLKTSGPFFISSGTILLGKISQRQWSNCLRNALKLMLRDTLSNLSDNVQQDEMLRLAMLRWIVDYWSTTNDPSRVSTVTGSPDLCAASGDNIDSPSDTPKVFASSDSSPVVSSKVSPPVENALEDSKNAIASTPTKVPAQNHEAIHWDDLFPMLDTTTKYMEGEISGSSCQKSDEENNSITNLKEMLASMNIDHHARPAVDAYKKLIQEFPPSQDTALVISVLRRCPACLALAWGYLVAPNLMLGTTTILLPFIFLEFHQVVDWARACHHSMAHEIQRTGSFLELFDFRNVLDPMCLMLSPDNYSPLRPPTLLQVWYNLQDSVRALEASLLAARCAQTTAVAAEFAGNIMSLAHLGYEVSQNGWVRGFSIMAKEIVDEHKANEEGRYLSAAKGAIRNTKLLAQNYQTIMREKAQFTSFLQQVIGWEWLRGSKAPVSIAETENDIQNLKSSDVKDTSAESSSLQEISDTPPLTRESTLLKRHLEQLSTNQVMAKDQKLPKQFGKDGIPTMEIYKDGKNNEKENSILKTNSPVRQKRDLSLITTSITSVQDSATGAAAGINIMSRETRTTQDGAASDIEKSTLSCQLLTDTTNSSLYQKVDESHLQDCETNASQYLNNTVTRENVKVVSKKTPRSQVAVVSNDSKGHKCQDSDESNNDWMRWVGGGLAVVGAVVGTVALATKSAHEENGDKPYHKHRRNESAGGRIIEISTEQDDSDDWVSIENDND